VIRLTVDYGASLHKCITPKTLRQAIRRDAWLSLRMLTHSWSDSDKSLFGACCAARQRKRYQVTGYETWVVFVWRRERRFVSPGR